MILRLALMFFVILLLAIFLFGMSDKQSAQLENNLNKLDRAYENTDSKEADREWFGETERKIMEMIRAPHPEAIPKVEKTFDQFHELVKNWEKLLENHKEALAQEDAMRLFHIKMQCIKTTCTEYVEDHCSKDKFDQDLDDQIDSLKELISTLAEVATLRDAAMP